MAPRLDRRLSLPPIAVLVDSLDDSDDDLEENILSYHSRRFKTYEKYVSRSLYAVLRQDLTLFAL